MLYFVFALVFVHVSCAQAAASTCAIRASTNFIDCSWLNLTEVPRFTGIDLPVTLSLRHNRIRYINLTTVFHDLPNLQGIILYGNPMRCSLQCRIARKIVLKSHCYCSIPTPTLLLATSATTNSTTRTLTRFTTTSVFSPITGNLKTAEMYIILLIASSIVILAGLLAFGCIYKQCTPAPHDRLNSIMEMDVVHQEEEGERETEGEGEEEELIFSRMKID